MREWLERWALWRGSRSMWSRAVEGWERVPAARRIAWIRALLVGFTLVLLVTVALTLAARHLDAAGALAWDERLLRRIVDWDGFTLFDAIWVDAFGSSAMIVPLGLVAVVLAARAKRTYFAASVLAAYVGAKAFIFLGWDIWDRSRPELILGGATHPPSSHNSFPSGHVLQVVAIYGLFVYLWVRNSRSTAEQVLAWLLLAALAAVASLGRLRLSTHWPSDMIAGILLGAAWLTALILALRRVER